MFNPGDVVVIDFPGITGVKRRPAVVVSSSLYHEVRPDIVVGPVTSQTTVIGPTDYILQDWAQVGLRVPSVFRCFFATLPCSAPPVVIGHLSERDWGGVSLCVRAALAPFGNS